jgi:hypothetical protein
MVVKPKNIDEYLAASSDDKRAALERLRKIIRAAVPKAEECISYQLPAFRLDGKCFVWFGAAAKSLRDLWRAGRPQGRTPWIAENVGRRVLVQT